MVPTAHTCQYGIDDTPPILLVVSIYPQSVRWTETTLIHLF